MQFKKLRIRCVDACVCVCAQASAHPMCLRFNVHWTHQYAFPFNFWWMGWTTHGVGCWWPWPIGDIPRHRINVMLICRLRIEKDTVNPIKFNADISISVFRLSFFSHSARVAIFPIYLFVPWPIKCYTDVQPGTDTPILSAQQNCRDVECVCVCV